MSIVTKEGVEVKVGQVWKDLDKRVKRTITVESIQASSPHPYIIARSSSGAVSRIRISRMHKHSQGFTLVSEAPNV